MLTHADLVEAILQVKAFDWRPSLRINHLHNALSLESLELLYVEWQNDVANTGMKQTFSILAINALVG